MRTPRSGPWNGPWWRRARSCCLTGQAEVEPAIIYTYSETGSDLPSLATVDKVQRAEITGVLRPAIRASVRTPRWG